MAGQVVRRGAHWWAAWLLEVLVSTYDLSAPEQLPILSRGKHRRPRKGACFMELASYLAGERWSDHPACTHPLLAAVARAVNDCTRDEARPRLAVLIPSVIGLASDDIHVDARIALRHDGSAGRGSRATTHPGGRRADV